MRTQGKKIGLVWFRNDLRIHDQEALFAASEQCDELIPLYIFNRRDQGKTTGGFETMGIHRKNFLVESVSALRERLRALGSDLIIGFGLPEYIIPSICNTHGVTAIYYGTQPGVYETQEEDTLRRILPAQVRLHSYFTGNLFPQSALPFAVSSLPDVFTEFKIALEKYCEVPASLPSPAVLPPMPKGVERGDIPGLELFLQPKVNDERASLVFKGGEHEGLKRLHHYVWETEAVTHYFDTRNELQGVRNFSAFSPWLANGSLSARYVYNEVLRFETERNITNKSTYWLRFELLWREFFRYSMLKHGKDYFMPCGLKIKRKERQQKLPLMSIADVANARTGNDMIDALLTELIATGYMSNRGRQMVASHVVNDLGISWLKGAGMFEHYLIDYDVSSNYGNWAYVAGKGCDPRADRYFNIEKQAALYDPEGQYRNLWLKKNKNYATHDKNKTDTTSKY